MSNEETLQQKLAGVLTLQRNEAADRHANCLAQLNAAIEEKVALALKVEALRDEVARLTLEREQQQEMKHHG